MDKISFSYDIYSAKKEKFFNGLSTKCVWNPLFYDNEHVGNEPDGFIKAMYPYVDYLILMTFTGGKKDNNWYNEDENGNAYYCFDKPIEILRNVLRGGVKPFIVIGQVPNALSKKPDDFGEPGTDWGNRYAPKDYNKYYDYIKAFGNALVENFGTNEIKSWKFRLMTEWDDCVGVQYWWKETLEEYFKMYDYTYSALSDSIGKDNLYYGVGNVQSLINLEEFLEHCVKRKNYYTGEIGTPCEHISISEYYVDTNVEKLSDTFNNMQDLADKYPSLNIREIGIGEGGIIQDSNLDRLHMAQGITEEFSSCLARIFDICNNSSHGYFANWEYLTDRANISLDFPQNIWLKTPASNCAEMLDSMIDGEKLCPIEYEINQNNSIVNSFASYYEKDNKLKIFMYYHSSDIEDSDYKEMTVKLINIKNLKNITLKRVDAKHGNFSRVWLADSSDIPRKHIVFDMDTEGSSVIDTPITLYLDDKGKEFYYMNRNKYIKLSEDIESNDFECCSDSNNTMLNFLMPKNGIVLFELQF